MERASRDSIIRRLEFARTELADLGDLGDLEFSRYTSDRLVRRNIERMIENVVNSLSDIGKIILSQADVEMPESYRDIFTKLASLGLIDPGLSARLADTTRLRNVLAHQYLDIKWEYIKAFLTQGRSDAQGFLDRIEEWMAAEDTGPG
ncbi:MAG: HepT-like ribonuclease domain-containing protein [Bacillota bacterium]